MRVFYAILLTSLVLFNWIEGCLLCFEHTRRWEAAYEMNLYEHALAQKLQHQQLLATSSVKIVDKDFSGRHGMAYPGDFVFTDTSTGDTTWFVVQTDIPINEETIVHLKTSHPQGALPDLPAPSFQDFFSPYLYQADGFVLKGMAPVTHRSLPHYLVPLPASMLVCLSPPPEQLG